MVVIKSLDGDDDVNDNNNPTTIAVELEQAWETLLETVATRNLSS
jgi:hypothetical protein